MVGLYARRQRHTTDASQTQYNAAIWDFTKVINDCCEMRKGFVCTLQMYAQHRQR